ncbi:glycoside hydrolase family 88 protein [Clostridium sp. NSJ-6]|uniref:Glycoside hydrolase family 88 protein n=2 Tax=Clostridium hominis TaxID=2763036 RepID=A0ABR7DFS1_9CLOT|nr:glycoside hydrolase family 88 protein [Clostridium hominis]
MIYITMIILLIVLTIVLSDIVPLLKTWVSRVHIGRYENEEIWIQAIVNKSIKWLNNTPKIKVTDNTRLTIIERIKGNYSKNAIQHWQQAALLLGLNDYLKVKSDNNIKIEINKFLKSNFNKDGSWKEKLKFIDCAILSYAVMNYDKVDKYKVSYDETYSLIRELIGSDETVKYRKSMEDYRYVDTIGFICPFLIKYGVRFNYEEAIELAINQIKDYYKYGFDNENIIPFHAYDIKNKYKLGLCGWGRGLGWFAIGVIDSWRELPENNKYKKEIEEIVVTFSKSILKLQLNNGAWGWTVTRKETRIDSSTTATLAYFLTYASIIKDIEKECKLACDKAIKYLMSVTRRDGTIDFSQGDTKDIGVYSMLFDKLPFTQGFALRAIVKASKEVNKSEIEYSI